SCSLIILKNWLVRLECPTTVLKEDFVAYTENATVARTEAGPHQATSLQQFGLLSQYGHHTQEWSPLLDCSCICQQKMWLPLTFFLNDAYISSGETRRSRGGVGFREMRRLPGHRRPRDATAWPLGKGDFLFTELISTLPLIYA
uniref:Uncharacterized protein n=1 Tax=Aegilops tauschii subsp. strangulata TaxID=200361 RepID=A0A453P0A9_AEGTS